MIGRIGRPSKDWSEAIECRGRETKQKEGNRMKWNYTVIDQSVRIDRAEEPELLAVIPEELDGLPVTELGAYVLAHSPVEEIHLPSHLVKIGAYGFYGCEKLRRIYCYGRVLDLGTGLFADASNVEFLDITLFEGEKSCFQELLSELRQTLRVRVHLPDGQEARLIFPEYYEEAVENTPARILFIETHGCGHRYRYCFVKREFQFAGYDEIFPHVQVQEPEELAAELAIGRLQYPVGLRSRFRDMYENYVREHWKAAGRSLLNADRVFEARATNLESGQIPWLAEHYLSEDSEEAAKQISELTEMAQKAGNTEMVSWLMDFRHRRCGSAGRLKEESGAQHKRKRRFEL